MLTNYLQKYFYTKEQLLELTEVSEEKLLAYQTQHQMPKASYLITVTTQCQSFFGDYSENSTLQYFAKGYGFWLGLLMQNNFDAYRYFYEQYVSQVEKLTQQLGKVQSDTFGNDVGTHIENEWQHFLNGTYGLCTRSGLPKDIATKEYAIQIINQLTENDEKEILNSVETKKLISAIKLLDHSISLFAPHERAKSSRLKYINAMIIKHKLTLDTQVIS